MNAAFSRSLSLLRREKGVSQRAVARELGISQALLSHYENGVREPGLAFVARACDYYGVSADFLLGRTLARDGTTILDAETLYDYSEEKDNVLKGSVMATLSKKLLVNSIGMVFDLLGRTGRKEAIGAATDYLGAALYKLFRHLHRANPTQDEQFFSVSPVQFDAGAGHIDMLYAEMAYMEALDRHAKEKAPFPELDNDALARDYPGQYQSLLQIIHKTGQRVHGRAEREAAGK